MFLYGTRVLSVGLSHCNISFRFHSSNDPLSDDSALMSLVIMCAFAGLFLTPSLRFYPLCPILPSTSCAMAVLHRVWSRRQWRLRATTPHAATGLAAMFLWTQIPAPYTQDVHFNNKGVKAPLFGVAEGLSSAPVRPSLFLFSFPIFLCLYYFFGSTYVFCSLFSSFAVKINPRLLAPSLTSCSTAARGGRFKYRLDKAVGASGTHIGLNYVFWALLSLFEVFRIFLFVRSSTWARMFI